MTDEGKPLPRIEYLLIEEARKLIEHISMALPDARKRASNILDSNVFKEESEHVARRFARHALIKQLIEFLNHELHLETHAGTQLAAEKSEGS
jgi:hypothetical protein